eukprot:4987257-Pyramimonas_sp.AAC.1
MTRAHRITMWAQPIVERGPYSLVVVGSASSRSLGMSTAWWVVTEYKALDKPFRKNVQLLVYVRASTLVRVRARQTNQQIKTLKWVDTQYSKL